MMAESSQKFAARNTLRTVFKRRRLFLLGASLFAIIALLGSHYVPLKYTGVTKLERRSEYLEKPGDKANSFDVMKVTLQLELAGVDAMSKAVEDLGLTKDMPHGPDGQLTQEGQIQKQSLTAGMMHGVDVTWDSRSAIVDLITVSFTHSDPMLAERLPNLLVANYINKASEEIVQRLTASRDFFLEKVGDASSRLDQVVRKKTEFEVKNAGKLPDSPSGLQQRIQELSDRVDVLRRDKALAEAKLAHLKGYVSSSPASGPSSQPVMATNPEYLRIKEDLQRTNEQLETEQKVNGRLDRHPVVLSLRKRIEMLEQRLKDTPAEGSALQMNMAGGVPNELALQTMIAQADVEQIKRDLEQLEANLASYEKTMANFGPIRQEYVELLKSQEELRAETNRWQQSLTEVQMSLGAEVAKRRTHLNTVQTAQKQIRPSSPTLPKVLAFAIIGSLAAGFGLVFLTNSLDRSIQTTNDAHDYFKLPIYGAVGVIETAQDIAAKRLRRWVLTPIIAMAILACLAAAAADVTIWLTYPQKYSAWRAQPINFMLSASTDLAEKR